MSCSTVAQLLRIFPEEEVSRCHYLKELLDCCFVTIDLICRLWGVLIGSTEQAGPLTARFCPC